MADEVSEEAEGKSKKPIILMAVAVLLTLILVVGAVVGTLFVTGFFDSRDKKNAQDKIEAMEKQADDDGGKAAGAAKGAASGASEPKRVSKQSPELARFEYRYIELDKDLVANLSGSKRFMSVKVALMTRYDERVTTNIKKHEFALRSVALDAMRQTKEAEMDQADFRKRLAEKIRDEMNSTLQKLEDFGGIEEIHFTSFVVQ